VGLLQAMMCINVFTDVMSENIFSFHGRRKFRKAIEHSASSSPTIHFFIVMRSISEQLIEEETSLRKVSR
jgi:hypothetical protein